MTTPKRNKNGGKTEDGKRAGATSQGLVSTCPWRKDLTAEVVDDGRVAYAYVRSYGNVIGEVWLYNHGAADAAGTVDHRTPARNPQPFASPRIEEPIASPADVTLEWAIVSTGPEVRVTLRGRPLARVRPFEKPGRCANAARTGPVARVLEPDRESQAAAAAGGGDDEG